MKNKVLLKKMKMKNFLIILTITTFCYSCNIFENKERKAIEVCQKAKIQFRLDNSLVNTFASGYELGTNATWLDFANMIAKQAPNIKYEWHAKITDDNKFYIVDFTDLDNWGYRWEVDIEQQIVKSINDNEYLTMKYGSSRFDGNEYFKVTEVKKCELKFDEKYNYYDNSNTSDVVFLIKASVLNKTNKIITAAEIEGKLKLIFKDKTVTGESDYKSGFKVLVSKNNPWEPNTTREFYIKTKGIEKIYLNYVPEYVVFDVSLKALDPVGFLFDKDIAEIELKENWKSFKGNSKSNSSHQNANKSLQTSVKSNKDVANESTENVDEDSEENLDSNYDNN